MIKLKTLISEFKVEKMILPLIKLPSGAYKQGSPRIEDFKLGKFYEDGDIHRYVLSQHDEFEDVDRINGIFHYIEMNPNKIPQSEWIIDNEKSKELSQSKKEFPPIVINKKLSIIDGGHRLEASKLRGDKTIKVFKQV